jgi:hypothetical protein
MNPLSIVGAFLITLALLFYGISSIAAQRFKIVTPPVLTFITLGILTDLVAVTFMIIGSDKGVFTPHGILGYTATLTMIIDVGLMWKIYLKSGFDSVINKSVLLYSKIAYAWWLIAYITGSLLVLW